MIICHHLNDYEKYKKMNISNIKFVYVGHGAEETIFKDYGSKKIYDLMLAGAVNSCYPLRQRLKKHWKN